MKKSSFSHRIFYTAEILEEILRHADRKSTQNVMTTCWHGFWNGLPEFYRRGSVNMLDVFGRTWCSPDRVTKYCKAVKWLDASGATTQEKLLYLSDIFPQATTLVGGPASVSGHQITPTLIRPLRGADPVFDYTLEKQTHYTNPRFDIDWDTIRHVRYEAPLIEWPPLGVLLPVLQAYPQLYTKLRCLCFPVAVQKVSNGDLASFLELGGSQAPHLHKLSIAVDMLDTTVIKSIAEHFPQLTRLKIGHGYKPPAKSRTRGDLDDLLETVARHLPHLRHLLLQVDNASLENCLLPYDLSPEESPSLSHLKTLRLLVNDVPQSYLRVLLILSRFVSFSCQVNMASPMTRIVGWHDYYDPAEFERLGELAANLASWTSQLSEERTVMSIMHAPDTRTEESGWKQLPNPEREQSRRGRNRCHRGRFQKQDQAEASA